MKALRSFSVHPILPVPLAPPGMGEASVKQLLGGVTSLLSAVGALRNELGDAHGKGKSAPIARALDARLVVNSVFAIIHFLIDCHRAG